MKIFKLLLILCLCLALMGGAGTLVSAAEAPDLSEFIQRYDGLLDDILDSFRNLNDGEVFHLTDGLREKLAEYDPGTLLADLKALLGKTAALSDEELTAAVSSAAEEHGISLEDSQIQQLCDLLRFLEKFSSDELKDKLGTLKSGTQKLQAGREKLLGFFTSAQQVLAKLSNAFQRLINLFGKT